MSPHSPLQGLPLLSLSHLCPPFFQSEVPQDEHCAICQRGASLQPCGTCPGAYHLSCLDPPLKTAPKGVWVCPRCQQKVRAHTPATALGCWKWAEAGRAEEGSGLDPGTAGVWGPSYGVIL